MSPNALRGNFGSSGPLRARSQMGRSAPLRPASSYSEAGYADEFRGWYDVQGCGQCLDYCLWVGDSGSGGSMMDLFGPQFSLIAT